MQWSIVRNLAAWHTQNYADKHQPPVSSDMNGVATATITPDQGMLPEDKLARWHKLTRFMMCCFCILVLISSESRFMMFHAVNYVQ